MAEDLSWLQQRLQDGAVPVIIDGGMGTELERAGVPMDGRVWSATAMLSHPDAVRLAHEAYIEAGAEVVITNTFSAARHMLEPAGLGDRVAEINRSGVRLAREARDNKAQRNVAIAGSICEWAATDDPVWNNPEAVAESAREQAQLLVEAGVDLIVLEMCEQLELSVAVIEAVMQTGIPFWTGPSARSFDGRPALSVFDLEDRDFEQLVHGLADYPAMLMAIMHTPIADLAQAQQIVRRHWSGPIGIYPESGYFKMPNWQFVDVIEPDDFARQAQSWIADGVRLVGGCCGLGPEHIRALRETLR